MHFLQAADDHAIASLESLRDDPLIAIGGIRLHDHLFGVVGGVDTYTVALPSDARDTAS